MRKFEKAIENKMLEGEALTDVEKRVYREAKLKQARKGKGPGRPFQMRKKSAKGAPKASDFARAKQTVRKK